MHKLLKRGLVSAAAISAALVPAGVLISAGSANAAPPPPHVVKTTSVQTSAVHLGPAVTVLRFAEYQPQIPAPGFKETATILEVCVNIPHVVPPLPFTALEACTWRLTTTGPAPHSTLSGNSLLNGDGQIGRVVSGTGIWAGAHSLLPGGFTALNIAPRTQADTFTFVL
jgi:hypothetical protein